MTARDGRRLVVLRERAGVREDVDASTATCGAERATRVGRWSQGQAPGAGASCRRRHASGEGASSALRGTCLLARWHRFMGGDPKRSSRQSSWWVLRRTRLGNRPLPDGCAGARACSARHASERAARVQGGGLHLELIPAVLNHVFSSTIVEPRIKLVDDAA